MIDSSPAPLLVIDDVTKTYTSGGRSIEAVRDVTFAIGDGETFGLVGESGSGKSTLGRLVLGLERPTAGRITFEGIDIAQADRSLTRRIRRDMQVVFQDPVASLNRRRTVRDIIEAPLVVHRVGTKAERKSRVVEVLELVQLGSRFGERYPSQLSGGQCQRVAIARALALSPRFVVLDEAVSAVDVSVQGQLLNLMHELQADLGLSYLFISHDLAVVRYMSERVAVMQEGRIVELATRSALFSDPHHEYTRALLKAIPEPPTLDPNHTDRTTTRSADDPTYDLRSQFSMHRDPRSPGGD